MSTCGGLALRMCALLIGLITACTEKKPKERVWQTPGFVYISQESDLVCEGVLATLSEHRAAIVRYLGLDDPSIGQVRYRKFIDRRDLTARAHCSPYSSACFFRQFGIESFHPFEQHELIHAYLAHLGDSHKLLEEGVAEALTCGETIPPRSDVPVEFAWSAAAWTSTDVEALRGLYHAGAWFVAYLLKAYPPVAFARFYQSVEPSDQTAEVTVKFAAVYADDLGVVWQRALAQPGVDGACVPAYACASPVAPPIESTQASATARCDGRPALETLKLDGKTWLSTNSSAGDRTKRQWQLGACEAHVALPHEPLRRPEFGTTSGKSHWLMLAPGRYWAAAKTGTFELIANDASLVPDTQCGSVNVLQNVSVDNVTLAISAESLRILTQAAAALGASDQTVEGAPPDSPGAVHTSSDSGFAPSWLVALQGDLVGARVRFSCSHNARVELCESCDYTARCQVTCDNGAGHSAVLPTATPHLRVTVADTADVWFRLRQH